VAHGGVAYPNTEENKLMRYLFSYLFIIISLLFSNTTCLGVQKDTQPTIVDIQSVGIYSVAAPLAALGYFQGALKQAKLKNVKAALKLFQRDLQVAETGLLDEKTWEKLNSVKLSHATKMELSKLETKRISREPVFSSNRTALVIGNAGYKEGRLSAPVLDAEALAKVLRKLGFQVIERSNLDLAEMEKAIGEFHQTLSQRLGVGLFYYSGHGIQYQNQNYLIPLGTSQSLYGAYELPKKTVAVSEVLEAMNSAGNAVNLVFLDACRTPLEMVKSWTKGEAIPPGMAKQSDVPGSLIAYAAAPGKPALDGKNGQNSPYVKYLLEWIQKPNLSISDALTKVRISVMKATKKGRQESQQPQYSNALNELFYFNPQKLAAFEQQIQPPPPQTVTPPSRQSFYAGKVFHDRLKDGSKGPEMVWIPAGSFRMGGKYDNEKPVHEVSVDRFAMGVYEVTFAEYDRFAKATGRKKPSDSGWGRGKRPVINVSWDDATAYTKWLSGQTGQKYRLPTEAEWEYAARAGTTTKYWWGNEIGKNSAACCECGAEWGWDAKRMTAPVDSFDANQFGIYNTVGNVWEWVRDWYDSDYYRNSPPHDPKGPSRGTSRVFRGGAWTSYALNCRAAFRYHIEPGNSDNILGFRLLSMP
jgi:formylglycine-generating enzyme required for sulfatase activity